MKKVSVSPQMRMWRFIIGLIAGNAIIIGVGFLDSIIIKIISILAFSLATSLVGILYSAKLLTTRSSGGKARLLFFIIFLLILISVVNILMQFLKSIPTWVYITILSIIISIIIFIVYFSYNKQKNIPKNENKEDGQKISHESIEVLETNNSQENLSENMQNENLYTLNEIWEKFGVEGDWLEVNSKKENIEYVKIKSDVYRDGKFYGFIKFSNSNKIINGEIFYSNLKVWYI